MRWLSYYTHVFILIVFSFVLFGTTANVLGQEQTADSFRSFDYKFKPVESVRDGEPIEIQIWVENIYDKDKATIHFRDKGSSSYNSSVMGYNPVSKCWEYVIGVNYHGKQDMEYYLQVFPEGLTKLRFPPEKSSVYTIASQTKMENIFRPIMMLILICSPILIAILISRIYRAHVRRTTDHQRKVHQRKRKLHHQRSKHYKDYLEKLSGKSKSSGSSNSQSKLFTSNSRSSIQNQHLNSISKPKPLPVSAEPAKITDAPASFDGDATSEVTDTGELKRELDTILSKKEPGKNKRQSQQTNGKRPAVKRPVVKKPVPKTQKPAKPKTSATSTDKTHELNAKEIEKAKAIPPVKAESKLPDQDKKLPSILDDESMDKNERDKLLDILGLDI